MTIRGSHTRNRNRVRGLGGPSAIAGGSGGSQALMTWGDATQVTSGDGTFLQWSAASDEVIGGLAVGTIGSTGIYNGYTLAGGDDFNSALDIFRAGNPSGRYGTTHVYYPGARSVSGLLSKSYDLDPFHTGAQDSKRGVPVAAGNVTQTGSVLAINVRTATAGETPYLNTRPIVSGMIHSGGYLAVTAPCIIESYMAMTAVATNPVGWHPTFWIQSASPVDSYDASPSPGGLEVDWPECGENSAADNFNTHGTTIGPSSSADFIGNATFGGAFNLYSMVLTTTGISYYLNGSLIRTVAQDSTNTNRPYYILFTGHTVNADVADFASKPAGATSYLDYYRIWLPTSSPSVVTPSQALPTQQIAFGGSFSYVFPSVATLYGSGVTDYCQGLRFEDMEPGCATEGSGNYIQFPAGYTWNAGTRTLTGTISDRPGRLNLISTPTKSGGALGYVARGYIDVGPQILTTGINGTVGTPLTYDVYPDCDCGTLIPKVMTVTGLPSGLSFSPTTGLITGTPVSAATTGITIGVTNLSGQNITKNINVTVAAAGGAAPSVDASSTNSSGTGPTVATPITTTTGSIVLVAFIKMNLGGTVTSITDTAGLTWTKRSQSLTSGNTVHEEWTAKSSGTLTSNNITCTYSGSTAGRITVLAVKGANFTTPFDTNASVPNNLNNAIATTTVSSTISTNHAANLTIIYLGADNALGTVTPPAGFTSTLSLGTFSYVATKQESSLLSSQVETTSWTNSLNASYTVDSIQGV